MSGAWPPVRLMAAMAVWCGTVAVQPAAAQQTVAVDLPPALHFMMEDITSAATSQSTVVSLADAALDPGKVLRVWVKADSANFTPPSPGSGHIAASKVSWTIAGAHNGIGSNGTLSSASYSLVFQSDLGQTAGSVELDWTLAGLEGVVRGGDHQVNLRWKLEAITP